MACYMPPDPASDTLIVCCAICDEDTDWDTCLKVDGYPLCGGCAAALEDATDLYEDQ